MALSDQQKADLTAMAKEKGVDPLKLVAEAERLASAPADPKDGKPPGGPKPPGLGGPPEKAGLPCYMLPFVKVGELRSTFLGLTDPFPGDDAIASDWATQHPAPDSDDDDAPPGKPPQKPLQNNEPARKAENQSEPSGK